MPFLWWMPVRGVPDLGDVARRPGNAAVDRIIQFPEAPLRLERDLHRRHVFHRLDGVANGGREVVGDRPQHRQRDRHHDQRRLRGVFPAGRVAPDDARAVAGAAQCADFGAIDDRVAEFGPECLADTAHAADRLHHRRRLVPAFAEIGLEPPEFGSEDPMQIERLAARAGLRSAAWRLRIAGAAGTLVGHVRDRARRSCAAARGCAPCPPW